MEIPHPGADERDVLPAETRRRVERIGAADLVVGIPSFRNARTVASGVSILETGLRSSFPDSSSVVCVSDGGSDDGTPAAAERATPGSGPGDPPERVVLAYRGLPGKGSALRAVFEVATSLGARACAVVDADLRSITPAWVRDLLSPVVDDACDFVAPLYVRHPHDGTITNSLAYPVTSALYGTRLRQPIGGEFGFSGALAARFARADVWETDVARFGIDIWMTTTALAEGLRVGQSILGTKVHDPRDPARHAAEMFRQVVGTMFDLAVTHEDRWRQAGAPVTPPTFGADPGIAAEPVHVSMDLLRRAFEDGRERWDGLWRRILSPEALRAAERGDLPAEPWVLATYDHLAAWASGAADREALLDSLLTLFFARTATFLEGGRSQTEAEHAIEEVAEAAVALRPHLEERWPRR